MAVTRLGDLGDAVGPARRRAVDVARRRAGSELCAGRTCYGHLAGELGMGLTDRWFASGLVTPDWQLTDAGRAWFGARGVDLTPGRRALLRPCLDWTEQRPHAAGLLGDRLAAQAFRRGWIERGLRPRSAHVTVAGATWLTTGATS